MVYSLKQKINKYKKLQKRFKIAVITNKEFDKHKIFGQARLKSKR